MSRRVERVSSAIKQAISKVILFELKDPRLGFLTVTKVELTADLKRAKVFVSVMGEQQVKTKTLKYLKGASGFIQAATAKQVPMKYFPMLSFRLDESVQRSIEISKLMERVSRELREKDADEDAEE